MFGCYITAATDNKFRDTIGYCFVNIMISACNISVLLFTGLTYDRQVARGIATDSDSWNCRSSQRRIYSRAVSLDLMWEDQDSRPLWGGVGPRRKYDMMSRGLRQITHPCCGYCCCWWWWCGQIKDGKEADVCGGCVIFVASVTRPPMWHGLPL